MRALEPLSASWNVVLKVALDNASAKELVMQKHTVVYDDKTIEFETNNTGIVSQNCFGPFEAAGITKAKLLEFEHHSFSKGMVVKIGDKSVRFSHDFEDPKDRVRTVSAGPSSSKVLEKVQAAIDGAKDAETKAYLEEIFADELKELEAIRERKTQKVKDAMALLASLSDEEKKALGLSA